MLRSINQRLARVEQTIPIPMTRDRFVALVHRDMKRTGESVESVIGALVRGLSDCDLDSLGAEVEQVLFGSDIAARDAARQALLESDAVQLGFSQ